MIASLANNLLLSILALAHISTRLAPSVTSNSLASQDDLS